MNLINFYYDFNAGEHPESNSNVKKTENLFNYLLDAGVSSNEIVDLIIRDFDNKDYLSYKDVPNKIWDKSLLERDKFYYHKELEILSKPPTWEETFPFFREMRIKYTEQDILNYFCSKFSINEDWVNKDKEIGCIKYLIDKYKMFKFAEPVDFMLFLIDFVKAKEVKVYKIYDICNFESEFALIFDLDIKNSVLKNKNTIIWR